ncbi:sugar-binding domain-containing protein [Virgibacillus sp. C22-A2]|uniref:Sugar-binding domain-containing protein n=1 Tax=Virgibacillus tibetensis TaxID=3042313 RepID=A0ABU6KJS4_9BACI|nr:sugar-binding domain-containing protein [Virgibacillus sp. C22-A2]
MRDLIDLQKKLIPDLLDVIQQRYSVLHSVELFQPIGRRGLAENTNLTERSIRSEVDFLQKQGLTQVTTKGMYITKEGKLVLDQLAVFMSEIMGLSVLEKQIKEKLNVENVIIIPGNSDEYEWIKQEMGKACIAYLRTVLGERSTIAVTGGSTMAAVADVMTTLNQKNDYIFVPARGGIGEKVENQANTIVAEMARKAKGEYRLLYVPDPLSESAYESIVTEPSINETLQQIKGSSIVLHGIGDALTMAERRKTPDSIAVKLKTNKAISEAFGYYFDASGNVVHKVRTVGIQLEDLSNIDYVITIAGGKSKGQAIASYFQQGKSDLLITDEAAAKQILRGTPL